MPSRANGYRANKAQRVEVQQWRDILHTLRDDDWIRGYYVMQQIVKILGFEGGPMGGAVMPRACSYCHYYGHSRQWCKKLKTAIKASEDAAIERMLREDKELTARLEAAPRESYVCTQHEDFDALGCPYTIDPDVGTILGKRGGVHHGKWTYDLDTGKVINNVFKPKASPEPLYEQAQTVSHVSERQPVPH